MASIKDHIQAGEFITVIPFGIQIVLRYNVQGNLFKVYRGFAEHKDITDDVMLKLINEKAVPQPIKLKGGSTFVYGILYTSEVLQADGDLSADMQDELLALYKANSSQFNFFAAYIKCEAVSINGGVAVRDQLAINGFRGLQSFLAPVGLSDQYAVDWARNTMQNFSNNIPAMYCAISGEAKIVPSGCYQVLVDRTERYVDPYGYVKVRISEFTTIDYSDFASLGIVEGSVVFFDRDRRIVKTVYTDDKSKSTTCRCDICGKVYQIPTSGLTCCDNPNCMSKSLPAVANMLAVFRLPELHPAAVKNYIQFVSENRLISILDVLDTDFYSGAEIHVSMPDLIRAMIPIREIRSSDLFTMLVDACNGAVSTLSYYISRPDRIAVDLGINHRELPNLIRWLSNPANQSDLASAISHPRIHIDEVSRRFDGVPAFRDKRIFITGKFIHGSLSDVSAILQSYSAAVTTQFDPSIDCVIVGSEYEDVDGQSVSAARRAKIPVYDELQFFQHFDIDSDIQKASGVIR